MDNIPDFGSFEHLSAPVVFGADMMDAPVQSIPEAPGVVSAAAGEGAEDEIIELDGEFDFEGYQVVRREFFAHTFEPSITFNNYKVYVNTACLNKFPDTEFVQALVNRERKILALRPCSELERDSFAWRIAGEGKRKPKQITCRLFFAKIFELMDWNMDYRYRLLGKVIHANGEYLIAFDLSATEIYQRVSRNGGKPKTSRTPVFPAGWKEQFGLPYKEHQKSLQVNIFDGYAVYRIKDAVAPTEQENNIPEVVGQEPYLLPNVPEEAPNGD